MGGRNTFLVQQILQYIFLHKNTSDYEGLRNLVKVDESLRKFTNVQGNP